MTSIKNELVGTWQLLSYIEISADGSDSIFPLGNNPNGILIYSVDGYMSVQIVEGNGSEAEVNQESLLINRTQQRSCMAFSGTYKVDNRNATVYHNVITSMTFNLEGRGVERKIDFEGDILYLKSVRPVLSNGKLVNSYMTWQRVEKAELNMRQEKFVEMTSKKIKVV